jgi:hypothetical protein
MLGKEYANSLIYINTLKIQNILLFYEKCLNMRFSYFQGNDEKEIAT